MVSYVVLFKNQQICKAWKSQDMYWFPKKQCLVGSGLIKLLAKIENGKITSLI